MITHRLRAARVGSLISALLLALVVLSPKFVRAEANNSRQSSQPAISIRLAEIWGADFQRAERLRWQTVTKRLKNSDPMADANRDLALGIRGLVTLKNTTWNVEHIAPGITCEHERSLYDHIVFTFHTEII